MSALYDEVIAGVVESLRADVAAEGLDPSVLDDLKRVRSARFFPEHTLHRTVTPLILSFSSTAALVREAAVIKHPRWWRRSDQRARQLGGWREVHDARAVCRAG